MRKYYLFLVKKEYYSMYKNKSYVLYKLLENLKNIETYDFSYGINIFHQLCLPFSVKVLSNYIENRINFKRINLKIIKIDSKFENTYLQINYSCIVIKTNINMPQIFKIFNIYSKNIMVCDFENQDYFWLNDHIKSKLYNDETYNVIGEKYE